MLVKLFKSNQRGITILVLLITILLWLPSFYHISNVFNPKYTVFSIFKYLFSIAWLNSVFAIIIIFVQAIYFNYIVNKYKLVKNNTHLTALIFVILNGANNFIISINPILFANIVILITLHQLLAIYNKDEAFSLSFNAGLLVGLGSLIYFPIIVLLPIIWLVLSYTKTVLWRELVISFLGFFLPFICLLAYYFLKDKFHISDFNVFSSSYFNIDFSKWTWNNWLYFIAFGVIATFSVLYAISSLNKHIVEVRKHMVIMLLILVVFASTLLINKFDYLSTYLLITVPMAVIIANFINELKRKWLAELMVLSMILAIIVGYFS